MLSKDSASEHAITDAALPSNGAAAAALMAAAIACATLGLTTMLAELGPERVQAWLTLYTPAGPLSGKVLAATLAYLLSGGALGLVWRGRNVNLGRWLAVAGLLIAAGFLLTFPPFLEIFAAKP